MVVLSLPQDTCNKNKLSSKAQLQAYKAFGASDHISSTSISERVVMYPNSGTLKLHLLNEDDAALKLFSGALRFDCFVTKSEMIHET